MADDYVLLVGFTISILLSLLVFCMIRRATEPVLPAARGFVLLLCLCDTALGLVAAIQWALAHSGNCTLAAGFYMALSSLEMGLQFVAFACAAAVAGVVGRIQLNRQSEDIGPSTRILAILCVTFSLPGVAHLVVCVSDEAGCPSDCGYSSNKEAPGELIKRGAQIALSLIHI